MNLLAKLRELAAMASEDRGDFLGELISLAESDDAALTALGDDHATAIAGKDSEISELSTGKEGLLAKIGELTAHNYELMRKEGNDVAPVDDVEEVNESDEDIIASLFGDDDDENKEG